MSGPNFEPAAISRASRTSLHRGIPEFSDLLLACRHHAMVAMVLGGAMAATLALLAWVTIRPSYHAEALVRVRENENVIFKPQTSRAEDIAFFRSQAAIVRSHQVLASAFADDEVQSYAHVIPDGDRIEWLDGLLRIETQSGPEVISITANHETPVVAQAFCNAVTRAYLAEITERIASDRQLREKRLEQAAVAADVQLDKLWENLNSLAQSVGSDNSESLTIRDQMQFQSYRDYAQQLQAAQLKGNQLQSQLAELQDSHGKQAVVQGEFADKMLRQHPEVIAARNQLAKLDQQCQQMQKIAASADSPQMKRLTDQRSALTAELEQLLERLGTEVNQTLQNQAESAHQQALAKIKYEIELNRSEKEFLRERLTELNSVVSRTTRKTVVPLDMTRHAVDRQSRLADGLWTALQELRIESQSPPRVALQALATLPQQANHSRQIRAAAASGAGGWMLVLFMIGYVEWRDCRVRSPHDLVSRSRFSIFGTNAYVASKSKFRLGFGGKQTSGGVREAVARIILRDTGGADTTTLMITSCVAGEPRHLISQEMGLLLGSYGRRVLLIDCDTDRAQLSHALKASRFDGIRQLMAGGDDQKTEAMMKLVKPTNQDQLDFIPIGLTENGQDWIDPRTLRRVISAMRPRYDVIIVNGPSMMGSAETALLAEEVDTSVFAVFIDRSRWDHLMLCEESACRSGIPVGGSILHTGYGKSDLALKPGDVPTDRSDSAESDDVDRETELHGEIDDLQRELRRVQAAPADDSDRADSDDKTTQPDTMEIND